MKVLVYLGTFEYECRQSKIVKTKSKFKVKCKKQ